MPRSIDSISCPVCDTSFKPYAKRGTRQVHCSRACAMVTRRAIEQSKVYRLSISDSAWLAGFIDGEGTIIMYHNGNPSPVWRLSAVNTDQNTMNHCKELTGVGSMSHRVRDNPKHSDSWEWYVSTWQAKAIVEQIEPYMITKKETARMMLAALQEDA